jgi:hypothetical protein
MYLFGKYPASLTAKRAVLYVHDNMHAFVIARTARFCIKSSLFRLVG